MSEPFIAEIRIWALNFAPRGWAFCNGQLLPIAQNTALFSIIGTTYGGDGRTTTGLPNLQGRAAMHPGNGPGLTPRRLGQRSGATTVTLTQAQMPSHKHVGTGTGREADSGSATSGDPVGRYLATTSGTSARLYRDSTDLSPTGATSGGSGQAHENMQPHLGLYYTIALQGVYPSRS